ncbi:peptidase G2 autoproteolytic cleavage domain-containing protein [Alteribacillus bidgolensis]|uniref:peptidase G2 autoproteolytic cleavage domain-containing protein n=1 Tax=Alteribacillus bidgolensis TaxID=930129 RepID=UPI003F5D4301
MTGAAGDPTQGTNAHAEGQSTTASGPASHAEGNSTIASGVASHAEGISTTASGVGSHAEGQNTEASGEASHAEGQIFDGNRTQAIGTASHAEGQATIANGEASHTEGRNTTTNVGALAAHAEGQSTTAISQGSHAEGFDTFASGFTSHAEGNSTTASGQSSHAEGQDTSTAGFQNAHIMGRFGDAEEAHSWFIGNGTSALARGLGAKWLASSGEMFIDGANYNAGGADFAEMFETADGNSIDVGYFVTVSEGDKVRIATSSDDFILGISSATPSLIGDSAGLSWHGRYVLDEWGRRTYHEVTVPAVKDPDGNELIPEKTEIQPVINPEWDPQREYIPRKKRPEWVPVGLIGKILVRDDGTCEEQGYCWPNDNGIATKAEKGYFVLKRTGENQVLVLLNSQPSTNVLDPIVKLEKLANLKEQGYLTEKEFQIQKQKLLDS